MNEQCPITNVSTPGCRCRSSHWALDIGHSLVIGHWALVIYVGHWSLVIYLGHSKDPCNAGGCRRKYTALVIMRWSQFVICVVVAVTGFSVVSCKKQQTFQVNGVVREVLPARKRVKIEHEKVPNYMEAMTMTFDVKDAKELADLQPGDKVTFRMVVTEK